MKKLRPQDLRIGMYIEQLDRPWIETPYQLEGVWVTTNEDIAELKELCEYVYVSEEKGEKLDNIISNIPVSGRSKISNLAVKEKDAKNSSPYQVHYEIEHTNTRPEPSSDKKSPNSKKVYVPFEEEIGNARDIHKRASEVVHSMYEDVRLGKSINATGAKTMVNQMVGSIVRNPDAQVWLTHLKNKDEYTAIHSLNVCIFSIAFGRHLGLPNEALNELGLGGLLHDLGKIRVPSEVLNKPGKLTTEEFGLMKEHPVHGGNILTTTKGLSPDVIDVALSHHERMNGTGYPHGLRAKEISYFGRIVSIVDIYDATTSNRVYHSGMHSVDAMTQLYTMRQGFLDSQLVEQFIQCLGIYPVGSIVELYSGEIGVVIEINREHRLRPKILLVMDDKKQRYKPPRIVDLAQFEMIGYDTEYDIVSVHPPESFGINIKDFIASGPLAR